jgi:hypothetical protein
MTYTNEAIKAVARGALGSISALLQVDEEASHVVRTPGLVSSELSNVVPVTFGWQSKVHGVELSRAAERGTSRVENSKTAGVSMATSSEKGTERGLLRLCIFWRIKSIPQRPV